MPKKHTDDTPRATGRRPRLSPTARAQAQRAAFTRRVNRRALHLVRKGGLPGELSTNNPELGTFLQSIIDQPVRHIDRVTGMPTFPLVPIKPGNQRR